MKFSTNITNHFVPELFEYQTLIFFFRSKPPLLVLMITSKILTFLNFSRFFHHFLLLKFPASPLL